MGRTSAVHRGHAQLIEIRKSGLVSVQVGRTSAIHRGYAQLIEIRKSGLVSVQEESTTYKEVMHSYLKYVSQGL